MALIVQYTLPASLTPAVRVSSGYLDPSAADPAPVVSTALDAGDTTALLTKFNALGVRIDNLGRYSGGGYAIAEGLALSEGTGLQASIAAGVILSDGHQTLEAQTKALTGGGANYLWALRTGAIAAPVLDSLTPPSVTAVYLGRMLTSGTNVITIDGSGVLEKRFGMLFRRTGDAGEPDDTPPAGIALLTRTLSGTWLWNGTEHVEVGAGEAATLTALDAATDDLETARRLLREVLWKTWTLLGYDLSPELANELEQAAAEAS